MQAKMSYAELRHERHIFESSDEFAINDMEGLLQERTNLKTQLLSLMFQELNTIRIADARYYEDVEIMRLPTRFVVCKLNFFAECDAITIKPRYVESLHLSNGDIVERHDVDLELWKKVDGSYVLQNVITMKEKGNDLFGGF